jgi:hypothetical protein
MSRSLKKWLVFFALILLVIFLFQKINWLPSFKNIFKSQPVVIDETPIIIEEIKSLAQLMTIVYTDEVAMDTAKPSFRMPSLVPLSIGSILTPSMDKLVIIGRGKVIAGTDLKKLEKSDVVVSEYSIHVQLPPSQILETIVNPSGFETFIETGTWSDAAVTSLKIKIRNAITKRAIEQNILQQANDRSLNIIKVFLTNTGFKKIGVSIADQSP